MQFFWSLFTTNGRDSRRKWWIISVIFLVSLYLMHAAWALPEGEVHKDSSQFTLLKIILIMTLLFLEFASCIRRWHDINKSGWWELILFIPVVGVLAALVANGFIKGTAGENDYGSDPLEDI